MNYLYDFINITSGIVVGGWLPPLIGILLLELLSPLNKKDNSERNKTFKYISSYIIFLAIIEVVTYFVTGANNFLPLSVTFILSSIFIITMHVSISKDKD